MRFLMAVMFALVAGTASASPSYDAAPAETEATPTAPIATRLAECAATYSTNVTFYFVGGVQRERSIALEQWFLDAAARRSTSDQAHSLAHQRFERYAHGYSDVVRLGSRDQAVAGRRYERALVRDLDRCDALKAALEGAATADPSRS